MRKGRDWTREITISLQFLAIEPRFVRKGCAGQLEIAIVLQFLTIEPHFLRKGCAGQIEIAILPQFLTTSFRAKGFAGQVKSQFYRSFWRSNLISCETVARDPLKLQFYFRFWRSNLVSCERVAPDDFEIAILLQFLAIEPHLMRKGRDWTREITISLQFLAIEPRFVRKGCAGRLGNRTRNFTSVFGDRTSFRGKGLRFVPSRWHCPCPRLQKRNGKEGEGKRARGQEEKMWRKMRRC